MHYSRYSYAHGGLSSLKEARDLLHKHAPEGEHLAYINPREAALLKEHGGSGEVANESGIRSYGLLKKITRPIAKILDKVVPNEIKPALPYLAALAPFTGMFGTLAGSMPGFGLTGSALELAQRGLLGGTLNTVSQLSQEGAEKRGLNPLSTLIAAGTAGLSGAGAGEFLGGLRPAEIGIETGQSAGFLDSAKNAALDVAKQSSEFLNKGREAPLFSKDFAKAAAVPIIGTATEQAYNVAQDALDKYNTEQNALGQMGVADQSKRRAAIAHAMQLSEPGISEDRLNDIYQRLGLADGGIGYQYGGGAVGYREGGLMSLGGNEMDFRAAGGFVPIGKKERADDVPARLSKNEFVFTANAVRNAGGGDIKQGAKKMYQIMKQLEARA
jgi:hypothetical protein